MSIARMKRFLLCVAMALSCSLSFGQDDDISALDRYLDSLASLLQGMPDNSQKLSIIDNISSEHYNVDSTFKYANWELKLAAALNSPNKVLRAYGYLGWCHYQNENYEASCEYYNKAIILADSLDMQYEKAYGYYGLGSARSVMADDAIADECFEKALAIFKELGENAKVAGVYRKMAISRINFHLYETGENLINKAFEIDMANNDSSAIADDIYIYGLLFKEKYEDYGITDFLYSAKAEMQKAYEYEKNSLDVSNLIWLYQNLADVYYDLAKISKDEYRNVAIDSMLYCVGEVAKIIGKCSLPNEDVYVNILRAKCLMLQGEVSQALSILGKVEETPKLSCEGKISLYRAFIDVCEVDGDYEKALKYTKLLSHVDKETYNRDFGVRVTSMQYERELSQQKLAQQKQRYSILIVSLCLFMMLVLAIAILHGYMRNRKMNRQLALQNDEIVKKNEELNIRNSEIMAQRDEIEIQRDNIEITTQMLMDSINYAKHIQNAVMTSHETMYKMFGDTLIYWKPLNIVSGDFYWAMQRDNLKIVVLADCTGHGVPGAFMSMFTISSLNSIVSPLSFANIKASDVLDMLRAKVIGELHQIENEGNSIESVDMAFCLIDTSKMQMQYAGANRPLLMVRDGKAALYKPDKMPVGLHVKRTGPFTNNVIDLKNGDTIYMYTDGITDQFGYEKGNAETGKFTSRRFDNLLQAIADKPFAEQHQIIDKTISDWRTSADGSMIDQYDDQLLLGVRIC